MRPQDVYIKGVNAIDPESGVGGAEGAITLVIKGDDVQVG